MEKRILESVKEFYKNVKEQEFSLDLFPNLDYFPDEQERNTRL